MLIPLVLGAAACGSEAGDTADHRGAIVIDESGAHLCGSLLESYPPQCGDEIVTLADLQPDAVVALQSPTDPTLAAASWTDYAAGVAGDVDDGVMTNVTLVDPVATAASAGLRVRLAVLPMAVGDGAVFPIDMSNLTDASITLTFTTAQRAEVTLSTTDGEEVYRWSDNLGFAQQITEEDFSAGQTFGATLTADPLDLPAGEYVGKAWITANEASNVVVSFDLTIAE